MSALPIPTDHVDAAGDAPAPALRLVTTAPAHVHAGGGGGRRALAPGSRRQAWRRRLALLVAVSCVVVVGAELAAGDRGPAVVPVAAATVVVQPGETLWEIAQVHAPEGVGTPAYVAALQAHNDLDGPVLRAWQVLRLPTDVRG